MAKPSILGKIASKVRGAQYGMPNAQQPLNPGDQPDSHNFDQSNSPGVPASQEIDNSQSGITDQDRIDFLQEYGFGAGGWVVRDLFSNRNQDDLREAIDRAITGKNQS